MNNSNETTDYLSLIVLCAGMGYQRATFYIIYGICIPLIAPVSILLNTASVIVLTRSSMRSSINLYLAGLSFFDGFLLLSSLLLFPSIAYCAKAQWCGMASCWCAYVDVTILFAYPLINITQTGSVWTLTAITVDRFIAIKWPLKSRYLLTVRRTAMVLAFITLWSLLYNLSTFFEFEFNVNGTLTSTPLRNNPAYILVYKSYCYLFFMFLVPAFTMIVLNSYITVVIRRARGIRRRLSAGTTEDKELRPTIMAVVIVCAFLVLNLTANLTNCFEAFIPRFAHKLTLVPLGNLLVTLNSATNFFIYSVMSLRFRRMFRKLFCRCFVARKDSTTTGILQTYQNTMGKSEAVFL